MRHYYHLETISELYGGSTGKMQMKSELFLSVTSVDDNGTFTCVAENKAGVSTANFTLHVVVPMPPKPPQVRNIYCFDHSSLLLALIERIITIWISMYFLYFFC